jgi:hypothetical protein
MKCCCCSCQKFLRTDIWEIISSPVFSTASLSLTYYRRKREEEEEKRWKKLEFYSQEGSVILALLSIIT